MCVFVCACVRMRVCLCVCECVYGRQSVFMAAYYECLQCTAPINRQERELQLEPPTHTQTLRCQRHFAVKFNPLNSLAGRATTFISHQEVYLNQFMSNIIITVAGA
jgi:hypothetical protein